MKLNITNGEYFNEYIKNLNIDSSNVFIPFNEAMIDGEITKDIFSNDFIKTRANHHNVDISLYKQKLYNLDDENYIKSFDEIVLWFGYDMFCQINMIVMLTYLKQINYNNKIYFIPIDDENMQILNDKVLLSNNIFINIGKIYDEVLVNKKIFESGITYIDTAIKNYINFFNGEDEVSIYIKNNINKDKIVLLLECLQLSKNLGLSDLIIEKIISKYKGR